MGTASATLYSVNGPISKDLALVPDTRELRIRLHEAATGEGLRARVSDDVAKPLSSESMIWVMPTNLRLEGDVIVCDVPADSAPTP